MPTFIAVCPHSAGAFQAEEVKASGDTREQVLRNAWAGTDFGRYILYIKTEDGKTTVWKEDSGWTNEGKKLLPTEKKK